MLRSGSLELGNAARVLWALTLVTLPVTSFRYFPGGEGTYVRPLSSIPLALLLLLLVFRWVMRQTAAPWTGSFAPLTAFLLMAAAAGLLGILLAPAPVRGQEIISRTARAWVTLLMGIGFFIGAVWMNRDQAGLRFTIKWMLVGFALDLAWSALQAATFYLHVLPKALVTQWQRAFSLRELIRTNRVSGMAYEPSWLAGQIATIYLPWLLAAVLTRVRVLRHSWLEPCLLLAALALLLTTFSRGGILTALGAAGVTLVLVARSELRSTWSWFAAGFSRSRGRILRLASLALVLASVVGGVAVLAQKGYVARLWNTRATDLTDFLIQNSAGARAAYLTSALQVYQEYPWTGVGLGASGFYMYARLPDWALTTVPEIARQLSPQSMLYPNPKNLYVRLLAETGILGFLLYLGFQLSLLAECLTALRRGTAAWRYVGIAGLCTWLALLLYNSTQDSLAVPNLWLNLAVVAGLVAAPRGSQPQGAEV